MHIKFVDWIPGICSALGMLVINSIEKTRLSADSYSYSGTGVAWKARLVLFLGFALMAGGLAGSVVRDAIFAKREYTDANLRLGCARAEIRRTGLSVPYAVLRYCKRGRKQPDHAEVYCVLLGTIGSSANTLHSSVVLWVSQNMEDDYTYNLAL